MKTGSTNKMSIVFHELNAQGLTPYKSGGVLCLDASGAVTLYRSRDLFKIQFAAALHPYAFDDQPKEALGEFLAGPSEFCLSFAIAYTLDVAFPGLLAQAVLEQKHDPSYLKNLSTEALFKEILAPYFSKTMLDCLTQAGQINLSIVKRLVSSHNFGGNYTEKLNQQTLAALGCHFSDLRFGLPDRSSLSPTAISVLKKRALGVAH